MTPDRATGMRPGVDHAGPVSRPGRSLVIVNPNAARLRDAESRRALLERLRLILERRDGAAPWVIETTSVIETGPAVEAGLAEGVSAVIGVGGDGTLRDIAAALANRGIPLGVIPGGTGNQLATALGLPRSPQRAADALEYAHPRSFDLGEVEVRRTDVPSPTSRTTVFTIGCGAGFDARLMATTPPTWKQRLGTAAYFVQGLRLVGRIRSAPYRITLDDRLIETDATLALIGNMGQLVPGFVAPRMPLVPDDGLLDLLVVGARNPVQGLRGLAHQVWRAAPGGGSGSSSIRLRGRRISVEPAQPEALQVDGDFVGEGSLSARVLPAAIEVLVPRP